MSFEDTESVVDSMLEGVPNLIPQFDRMHAIVKQLEAELLRRGLGAITAESGELCWGRRGTHGFRIYIGDVPFHDNKTAKRIEEFSKLPLLIDAIRLEAKANYDLIAKNLERYDDE